MMPSLGSSFKEGRWVTHDVHMGPVRFPYHFGRNCLDRIGSALAGYDTDRYVVVTDETVRSKHGDKLVPQLAKHAAVDVLSLPAGEKMKSLTTLSGYLERTIAAGASRRSVVIAFGGGVPGNLAGTLAALLFRGVRLVHVPTTTIAAMDSVISLKQAVNSSLGKNHFGSYHAPEAVYTDVELLQTLPIRELRSGMCEATKNCLAIRPRSVSDLRHVLARDELSSSASLLWLLEESLRAKSAVMARDPKEQRLGLILEYGHTVGHAVELCDQRLRGQEAISHGEAVALGMLIAARVSSRIGGLDDADVAVHDELVAALGAAGTIPPGIRLDDIMALVAADNKRGYLDLASGEAAMVLLRSMGEPFGSNECPLIRVSFDLVHEVLTEFEGGELSFVDTPRPAPLTAITGSAP